MKTELFPIIAGFMAVHNVQAKEYIPPYDMYDIDWGIRKDYFPDIKTDSFTDSLVENFDTGKLYIIQDVFDAFAAIVVFEDKSVIAIGPYMLSGRVFNADNYISKGFEKTDIEEIKNYILSVPHIHEEIIVHQLAAILAAALQVEKIEIKHLKESTSKGDADNSFFVVHPEDYAPLTMDELEERYNIENRILEAVAIGDIDNARRYFRKMMQRGIVNRYTPSTAGQGNSLIILNTLFRKAIEQAGVHPYYLDEISYRFYQRIETVFGRKEQVGLLEEMLTEYCGYAKKYSVAQYSPTVQRAINSIHLNIASKISLKEIADMLEITPNHLARVFNAETGKTVVDYINHTRVKIAANKLKQTDCNVTEIAESVGVHDINYFSRLFRKYMGCSPTEYRK